ncbi:alpha/beta hydrolase [Microvirga terricola]|uniref:Alpha/beta hydrolase n=1 Tax=Microvirga terricola TaxID=2719797 RepID=A0ABX0VCT2_9HYPH|nr:alpha/beta hydrolase [Microvirga terricola]NIX77313.1 alpha/beta hydrolase [Microvirga terricola]
MTTTTLTPEIGRSSLPFIDPFHPDRPIEVNFYRPAAHGPDDPVVIVQHGMLRNGDEYRDFWIPAAEKHRILIAAPTFSDEHYPKSESYNNGLVIRDDGDVRPYENWLYSVPGRVFAALRKGGVTRRSQARLFGHSAGGQFAHRMLATQGHESFEAVIAGNPGWYTLPTLQHDFPEGIGRIGLDEKALVRWLAYPMTIFAGDQDISTDDPNLPAQAEALRQGPHRYARAHFVYDFGRREAERLGLPFRWQLVRVEGIGHDGAAMSRAAAAYWFEGRIPPAEELVTEEVGAL